MAAHESSSELLLDVRVAEASSWYKFNLKQEKKILGGLAVGTFLVVWELAGNIFQWINPMFMSAPSFVFKAAFRDVCSGEIYNDLYVSGIEFFWGYFFRLLSRSLSGSSIGWYKRFCLHLRPIY